MSNQAVDDLQGTTLSHGLNIVYYSLPMQSLPVATSKHWSKADFAHEC